jgi:hypothetical protein
VSRSSLLILAPAVLLADALACLFLGLAARRRTVFRGSDNARLVAMLSFVIAANVLLVFGMCTSTAFADPAVTDQRIEAPDRLTVGDRIRVVIKLNAEPGTDVTLAPGSLNDPFVLTQQPASSANGRDVTLTLDLAVFATGDLQLPSLRLAFTERNGNKGEVVTRPGTVRVESVLPADTTDVQIRDLKPQAEIAKPAAFEAWVEAGVGLGLLAVALIAFLMLRRRARPRRDAVEEEPDEDYEAAEDRARGILDRAGAAFQRDGDYVTYYTTLANTLREYLTARFGFPAFALTTTEMQDQMVRRGMDRWQARIAGGLLNQCDAVVYARYRPAAERADADLTAAYEIVEMSRPGEPAPEDEAVPV